MRLTRRVFVMMMLIALSFGAGFSASAQTWAETFKQKKTQKKYLLNQIAALQVYIGYARKGYDIAGRGIHLVKDISNGEFSLHRNFFASLAAVNPSIKNSAAVAEVISGQLEVLTVLKSWASAELGADDRAYVSLVKAELLADCLADLEELFSVITAGKLEMKDDERLSRLEKIRVSMRDKQDFALSFSADLSLLIRNRKREQQGIADIRRWYELE